MTVLALVFGPSRTGYHAGVDHFNFDIEQWLAQGYVDGGECVNLRREGQSCKGDGESVNNGGYCTGCFMARKRKSDGAQYDSDKDQHFADTVVKAKGKKPIAPPVRAMKKAKVAKK